MCNARFHISVFGRLFFHPTHPPRLGCIVVVVVIVVYVSPSNLAIPEAIF